MQVFDRPRRRGAGRCLPASVLTGERRFHDADNAKQFEQGLGAWFGLPSQIYPELKKLEEKGLIEGESPTEDRLNKRIYRLTAQGERDLLRWVDSTVAYKPPRDAERVQLILMDRSSPESIRSECSNSPAAAALMRCTA